MSGEPASASLLENARFNALVVVPNALQGIFRRRRAAVAVATRADVDGRAVGLLRGMRRSYGGGPVWVRVISDRALLLLSRADVVRVLEGSPHPFAADPEAKRKGMSHFQPHALTISRGDEWRSRRRFTEAVLDTGRSHHRLEERFARVCREETDAVIAATAVHAGRLDWDGWQGGFQRLVRRVVLGDRARDDEAVTGLLAEMMSAANSLPGEPSERLGELEAKLEGYLAEPEEGSLCALVAEAPQDAQTDPAGQLPHWLFASHDTLAINCFRALALIASHPRQRERAVAESVAGAELGYLGACLQEAMRLWPTTPMLSRETLDDVAWDGTSVPGGSQVVIVNTFMHRDPDRHAFADRFVPEEWLDGDAAEDWSFNHFSHGPQGCPGAGLAIYWGEQVLARVLSECRVRLDNPSLDPLKPLPHMLDFFSIRFALDPRQGSIGATRT
jgi:cytochrome P450